MRLLVLDGSRILTSLVRRLVPTSVDIETVGCFEDACRALRDSPPAAVIVNLSPTNLPWEKVQLLCRKHDPPIPVLYESCVHRCPEEAGLKELDDFSDFLVKPYSMKDLRRQVLWLLRAAETMH